MSARKLQYETLFQSSRIGLTPRRLADLLRAKGWRIDSRQIKEHRLSGRNRLFVVEGLDGRSWLAKQTLALSSAEPWFYREAASGFEATPRCLIADQTADLVVMERLVGFESLRDLAGQDIFKVLKLLPGLARLLARLHRLGKSFPQAPEAMIPFPELDPIDLRFWIGLSSAAEKFVKLLQGRRRLSEIFHRALRISSRSSLIHGDLKFDNVLCGPSGRLVLLDWECSGLGAPEWDLGAVVGSVIMGWVDRWADLLQGSEHDPQGLSREDAERAVRRFLKTYLEEVERSGQATPDRETLIGCAVSWMVGRSWTEATFAARSVPAHPLRLLVAEELALNPDAIFGDWIQ